MSRVLRPSLTPTLGHIAKGVHSEANRIHKSELSALLVGVSRPDNHFWSTLPYATEEVRLIKSVFAVSSVSALDIGGDGSNSQLRGVTEDVLRLIPGHSILHLACHGHQDSLHPLDSGFVMQDGMLTLSKLLALDLPNAFMAFLSACETAKGDRTQPDQAIHLAATMLFAGFKSVVGTMW